MKTSARAARWRWKGKALVFSLVLWLCHGSVAAAKQNPYRIGFVGGLTGRASDLGIQGRNGALLAVEEINQQGGVNGRLLELITRDDMQDPQTAVRVDQELIEAGVIAIVGHMTSAMTEAALPLINARQVLLISPTTTANSLTGIDDQFLRVIIPSRQLAQMQAGYAYEKLHLRAIASLHDLSNRAYTEEYAVNFKAEFERLGGEVVSVDAFSAGPVVSYKDLAQQMLRANPDGVILIAGAVDTAMLCQHLRMAGSKVPILVSGWAQTPDLLRHGGPAVEGVIGTMVQDPDSAVPAFVNFKNKFQKRHGDEGPTFAAIFGYEAVMVLKDALSRDSDPRRLKQTILQQKIFQGLQGSFEIDSYGDAKRDSYIIQVNKNRFGIVNP